MNHSDFLPVSKPALRDVRSCDEWIARAALADPQQACAAFLGLLEELEDAPPRHGACLQILERLRRPILTAQEETARKFSARPLPLGHGESAAFHHACDLWAALARVYRRLLRAALKGGAPESAACVALLCERAVEYAGELIGAHLLGRQEIGEDPWHRLHEAYALAEPCGDAALAGSGPGTPPGPSPGTTAYLRTLMLALAQPYALREREFAWVRRWSRRWAAKARIGAATGNPDGYRIDLAGSSGPLWSSGRSEDHGEEPGPGSVRHLDFTGVARSIRWRLKKLEAGVTPEDLGLGHDCVEPAAGELLRLLLGCWARAPKSRQLGRRATHAAAELVSGMASIHAALGGEETPVEEIRNWDYSRRDAERIPGLPHAPSFAARRAHPVPGIELWDAVDESASGFRLHRRAPGARLAHRQLVALRPHGAQQFILCELRWLIQGDDQTLSAGAAAMVGRVRPVSVRPLVGGRAASFSHALVLPLARDLPASLVLPGGWYQPGRTLEMSTRESMRRIRLTELLARGYDFDHARFEVLA